jgi:hypothetical protein
VEESELSRKAKYTTAYGEPEYVPAFENNGGASVCERACQPAITLRADCVVCTPGLLGDPRTHSAIH